MGSVGLWRAMWAEILTTSSNKIFIKSFTFPIKVALNAGSILRQLNGKYSAYDMAQYIFWTGDEEGVAKAVEELIDDGLMSRENAIEFLNDIRLGIDYLENTYSLKHEETKNVSDAIFKGLQYYKETI